MRCDLCNNKGRIAWTYVTPCTADSPENAVGGLYWCEDPEWAVCEPCHLFIKAKDPVGLMHRSLVIQSNDMVIVGDDDGFIRQKMFEGIAKTHAMFWKNLSLEPPTPEPGYRLPEEGTHDSTHRGP